MKDLSVLTLSKGHFLAYRRWYDSQHQSYQSGRNDHLQFTIFVGNFVDAKQCIFRDFNNQVFLFFFFVNYIDKSLRKLLSP